MKRFITIISILLVYHTLSFGNILVDSPQEDEDHHHHHSNWEAGVAVGGVYLINESGFAPGLHMHLLRRLPKWERVSLGLGLESVFDEHTHFNTAIVAKYDLWKGLSVVLSPGLLFLKHETEWDADFSTHFEMLYEFQVGKIHLGPVIEYSYSKHDKHLMLGLHLGIGF